MGGELEEGEGGVWVGGHRAGGVYRITEYGAGKGRSAGGNMWGCGVALTLEMALVRVGFGAEFLEPKRRFMVGGVKCM